MIRPNTRRCRIMLALAERPRFNSDLCEVADEIPALLARTMAALIANGWVKNISRRRGRGTLAFYAITDEGRAVLPRAA
jgi:DNA-binding PadR family transcriptional regulator